MSTVAMMIEAAERLSKDRAAAQNAAQVPQRLGKSARDKQHDQDKREKNRKVDDNLPPS